MTLVDCAGELGGPRGAGLKNVSAVVALAACAGGFGGPSAAGLKNVTAAVALAFCAGGFGGPSGAGLKNVSVPAVLSFPGGAGPLSPTSPTRCGFPVALLRIVSEAVRCPVTVGVN